MRLADWIRASIWEHPDCREALSQLFAQVTDDSTSTSVRMLDLAQACELIEPDRRRAFAAYHLAWRLDGSATALARAFELARELGDHDLIATLALAAYDVTRDAAHLVAAGLAYVDSTRPALAEAPFVRAVAARPRDDETKALLAMIKRQVRDPQVEISSWVARATRTSGADAGRLYLQAARLARLAGLDAIYARHLETAYQRGRDPRAGMLIEAELLSRRRASELLAFYRGRIEAARGDSEWAELMRLVGTKLAVNNVQRGLAIRMLRTGLEGAYRARLTEIPGHLASWDLLIRHAREARSTRELMPLVVEAMRLPLSDDERLVIARFGFEVTWREARDAEAARPYAAVIAEYVPSDPALLEFVGATLPAPPTSTAEEAATAPLPPEPIAVRMKKPATLPPETLSALRAGDRKPGLPTSPPIPQQAARVAERVVVPADVEVRVGEETFPAIVRDLSATGIYIVTEHDIAVDTVVTIVLELPAAGTLEVTRHEAMAKVVRRAYTGYGMLFIDPPRTLVDAIAALAR